MKSIYQSVNVDQLINIINKEEIKLNHPDNLDDVINKVRLQFKNNSQPYDELLKNYLANKVFKRALLDKSFKLHDDDKSLAEYAIKKDSEDRKFLKVYHYLFEYKIDDKAIEIEEAIKYHYPMLQIKINQHYEKFKSKILDKVIDIFKHTVVSDFNLKRDKSSEIVFKYKADDKLLGKVVREDIPLVDIFKLVQHILSFDLIDSDMPLVPVIQEPYITRVFCFNKNLKDDAVRYVFNSQINSGSIKVDNNDAYMSLGRVKKIYIKKSYKSDKLEELKKAAKEKGIKVIIK